MSRDSLCELTRQFEAVTLQDINPDAPQTATDKFDLSASQKSRIHTAIAELNGFEASHVDEVMPGLDQEADAGSAAMMVTDRLLHLAPRPFVAAAKADLVVASCVLSQLHIPILRAIVDGFEQPFPDDADASSNRQIGEMSHLGCRSSSNTHSCIRYGTM